MGNYETDVAAINALYDKYVRGLNNDDFELFISVWADDSTRMESDIPAITSLEHIRPHFKVFFEQFTLVCGVYGDSDMQVSGDLAFYRGNYTLALTPRDGGPTTHIDGKYLDILKKQPDGSWKIYIDSVSDNAPPKVE
jgi:uncharacterized protein (TIGR02246 family)